jgi:hypothetical protein
MSSTMPVSSRTRVAKSRPLVARRHASVATDRDSETLRRLSLSAQIDSAATARSIASLDRAPLSDSPSPSRTMREKASMTVNVPPVGRAISRRQLLVPRSIAP